MNLTHKQKLYFGILGLGLLVLTLDRTVFSPDTADATESSSPATSTVGSVNLGGAGSNQANPGFSSELHDDHTLTVSQQLRQLADRRTDDNQDKRDAFLPSKAWFSDDGSPDRITPDQIIREFKDRNQLIGVLFSKGQSKAMMSITNPDSSVNSKRILLAVGDSIDLFKLIRVDERTALFERGSIQIVVEVNHESGEEKN